MSESNIYQLLVESNKNDELSFKTIYLEFYPKLIVFSKGYVKQLEISEDIVDDIFLKLWDNRSSLSHIKNLKFYLFVSVKNACLNYLNSISKVNSQSIDDFDLELGGISISPEDCLISKEKTEFILQAIQTLPPKCKVIFILIKEEGLKYAEVAELLNISIKTVESQMTIALRKLSDVIKFEFPEIPLKSSKRNTI